jgi:hypothetical protein
MFKLIGNATILVAGAALMAATLVAVGVLFVGASCIYAMQRLKPRRALPAGSQ